MRQLLTLVSAFLFGAMVHGSEVSSERVVDQQKATCTALNNPSPPPPRAEGETELADALIVTGTLLPVLAAERTTPSYNDLAFPSLSYRLPEARAPPAYL